MPNYNSEYTGAEIDESVGSYLSAKTSGGYIDANTLAGIVATVKLTMYPVGSIYMSVESTDPGTFIGGTWQRIQDTFLLAAGSTYAAGGSGGNASHTHEYAHTHGYSHTHTTPATTTDSHTLVEGEVPAHTHTRGTMNITGQFRADPNTGWIRMRDFSGAFYAGGGNAAIMTGGSSGDSVNTYAAFDASRSWTGATSSYGGGGRPYPWSKSHHDQFAKYFNHKFTKYFNNRFRFKSPSIYRRVRLETYCIKQYVTPRKEV